MRNEYNLDVKYLDVKIKSTLTGEEMTEAVSGTHLWLVLLKAHRALLHHAVRSIEELDMCLSDFGVLEILLHKGPQKVTEIGRKIDLTSGAITTAIDRLESRRLVARMSDANDRRARVVRLTPRGRTLIVGVFAAHSAAMERATSGLTGTESATLTRLLRKLGKTAEAQLPDHEIGRTIEESA
jgi:MarR family 2-MHQ and catechol resistance regulon transcriptional repressor